MDADYFGLVSGNDVDKFAVSGRTPIKSELVDAPYVAEFPLIIECRLLNNFEIGLHTMFIGEIMDVKADRDRHSPQDDKLPGFRHGWSIPGHAGLGPRRSSLGPCRNCETSAQESSGRTAG